MEQRWLFFSFLFLLLLFAFRVFFFSLLGFVVALFLTFLGFRVRERTDPSRMVEILSIILYKKRWSAKRPSTFFVRSFFASFHYPLDAMLSFGVLPERSVSLPQNF